MFNNLPIWVKATASVFMGGFSGAALMAIGDISTGIPVDYKKAFSAGLAGGIIAVLAYLKPAPSQVAKMLLAGFLFLGAPLTLIGCGNQTTLNKVGIILTQGAAAFKNEVSALKVAGQISDDKFRQLDAKADALIIATGEFSKFLNGLATVDSKNAAQVLTEVAKVTSLTSAILQNAALGNLPSMSKPIRILNIGTITLQEIAAAIVLIQPPPGEASFSTLGTDSKPPVPASQVKVKLPRVPRDLQQYFK